MPDPPFAVPVRAAYTEAVDVGPGELDYDYTYRSFEMAGELRAQLAKPSATPELHGHDRESDTRDELWWLELELVGEPNQTRIYAQALARYCTADRLY